MAGGKGGSTTSSVQIPEYIERAAQRNLNKAERISQLGYVPYYGPDVAAFTPMQQAAMQNVGGAASAFGLAGPTGEAAYGMPAPTTYAGGIQGYSAAPMYEQSVAELARQRPAQKSYIDSFFIDPYTGEYGSNVQAPVDYTGYATGAQQQRAQQMLNALGLSSAAVDPSLAIQPDAEIFASTPSDVKVAQQILATDPTNPKYNDAFETVYNYQSKQAASDPYGQSTGFGITPEVIDAAGIEAFMPPSGSSGSKASTSTGGASTSSSKIGTDAGDGMVWAKSKNSNALVRVAAPKSGTTTAAKTTSSSGGSGGGSSSSSDSGCVVATHAVNSGAFTPSMKREAVVWCMNVLHDKWWGEAVRRGYRHLGRKKIEQGKAHEHYQEFRDYIAFASGKKRTIKGAIHFAARTAQFFVIGLVKGDA